MKLPIGTLLLAVLGGCGPSEGSFISDLGREGCKIEQECYPEEFDAFYEDMGECRDDFEALFEDGFAEDCTFDGGKARKCLSYVRKLSCEEFESGGMESTDCENVYTDCPQSGG